MRINGIIWIDDIVEKLLRKHNLHQDEVREILSNKPLFKFVEKGHRPGEDVYAAMGKADGGRRLIVFFVRKPDGRALILSGRDMTKAERRQYEKA
ncbi:MAG: BrnT family toxin [Deltaproteobacteria bacterium]|nr:BrnT family toxin [Deltaproteobacteria bacterium]